jgi:hypothetical protein
MRAHASARVTVRGKHEKQVNAGVSRPRTYQLVYMYIENQLELCAGTVGHHISTLGQKLGRFVDHVFHNLLRRQNVVDERGDSAHEPSARGHAELGMLQLCINIDPREICATRRTFFNSASMGIIPCAVSSLISSCLWLFLSGTAQRKDEIAESNCSPVVDVLRPSDTQRPPGVDDRGDGVVPARTEQLVFVFLWRRRLDASNEACADLSSGSDEESETTQLMRTQTPTAPHIRFAVSPRPSYTPPAPTT